LSTEGELGEGESALGFKRIDRHMGRRETYVETCFDSKYVEALHDENTKVDYTINK
jgi:hypothetical protein